jgi:hypothetical protein
MPQLLLLNIKGGVLEEVVVTTVVEVQMGEDDVFYVLRLLPSILS